MDAPTNVPAETAVATTIEATIAPSGMKMIFETRQTKHVKCKSIYFFKSMVFVYL